MHDVHTHFDDVPVLRGVDLQVQKGTVHFVLGVSGAGKSVILKHLVGLVALQKGEITCVGQALRGLTETGFMAVRQQVQLVFQQSGLFDHLTVLENVALALRKRGLCDTPAEAQARAQSALQRVQAEHLAERYLPMLGLGLQKRIAIARALALSPTLILYDEPTTGLDAVAARRCDALIAELATNKSTASTATTQLVVSHDLTSVRNVADVVSFLHAGRITFTGGAGAFFNSDRPEIRKFIDP